VESRDYLEGREGSGGEGPGPGVGQVLASVGYVFAHQALPSIAFDNPGGFLASMSESNPEREAMLRDLWRQVRERCPWDSQAAPEPSFEIRPFVLCGHCGILVGLPEPQRVGEAYFAAVVVHLPESAASPSPKPLPTWYFTLERTNELVMSLLPTTGNNRLVNALRSDPRLLPTLLGELMFRGSFYRDLGAMTADLIQNCRLHTVLPALLTDPTRAVQDAANFAAFLDEYERRMPPSSTCLCGWTADGVHKNYGPGPRPDAWSFLGDLAVWLSVGGQSELARIAPGQSPSPPEIGRGSSGPTPDLRASGPGPPDGRSGVLQQKTTPNREPERSRRVAGAATAWKRDRWFSVAMGVFFLIGGIWSVASMRERAFEAYSSIGWPTAPATITQAQVVPRETVDRKGRRQTNYFPIVEYTYVVDGQSYRGTRFRFWPGGTSNPDQWQRMVAEFQTSRPPTVRYKPSDPSVSVVVPGPDGLDVLFAAGGVIAAIGGLLFAITDLVQLLRTNSE
jgi:hypothetical protein